MVIAVASFFGVDLGVKRSVLLILGLLPIICFAILIRLWRIERRLSEESRYFSDSETVVHEMIRMCDDASDFIMAAGTRTKKPLLDHIESALATKEVYYRRIVTDPSYMSADLIDHADRLTQSAKQTIKVVKMKNSPNFLLTEKEVMVVLPVLESGKFRGVLLTAQSAVDQYREYFDQLFYGRSAKNWVPS
ncbi:MAG: hypothetical protein FWD63_01895 [Propionibacteriaceae bacterium]|nr:hypothetical protein [Propionibacteriaceae bacterium]